jgi:YqjK-like protein
MADRYRELELERERLLARSGQLRVQLGAQSSVLRNPLTLADKVRAGARWLRQHPEVPLGALAVLVVLRPVRLVRWSGRLLWGWQLWRRARPAVQWLSARLPH